MFILIEGTLAEKMWHLQVDVAGNAMNLLDGVDLAGDAVFEY